MKRGTYVPLSILKSDLSAAFFFFHRLKYKYSNERSVFQVEDFDEDEEAEEESAAKPADQAEEVPVEGDEEEHDEL